MRKTLVMVVMLTALSGLAPHAQDSQGVVEAASYALGMIRGPQRVDAVNTIAFWGTGTMNALGQAYRPEMPWPAFKLTNFKVSIKYSDRALRFEMERTNPDGLVQGGGGLPLAAPQKLIQVVAGKYAWNESQVGAGLVSGQGTTTPAIATYNDRLLQFWMLTPEAVIKAAREGGANTKLTTEGGAKVLTFPAPGLAGVMMKATLNAKNLIDRVEARVDNPVLGDTVIETTFSDYRDLDLERETDILVPHRIVQK